MTEIVRVKPGESGYEKAEEAKRVKRVRGGSDEAAKLRKREYAREYYRKNLAKGARVKKVESKNLADAVARVGGFKDAIEVLRKERDELDRTIATLERIGAKC